MVGVPSAFCSRVSWLWYGATGIWDLAVMWWNNSWWQPEPRPSSSVGTHWWLISHRQPESDVWLNFITTRSTFMSCLLLWVTFYAWKHDRNIFGFFTLQKLQKCARKNNQGKDFNCGGKILYLIRPIVFDWRVNSRFVILIHIRKQNLRSSFIK